HADTRISTAKLVRAAGFDVTTAATGEEAVRAAERAAPDVVLLDLSLSEENDGYEVAQRLRDRAGAKRPLTVAVTGRGRPEDRRRSVEAGIDLHLVKPADPEMLLGLLGRMRRVLNPEG